MTNKSVIIGSAITASVLAVVGYIIYTLITTGSSESNNGTSSPGSGSQNNDDGKWWNCDQVQAKCVRGTTETEWKSYDSKTNCDMQCVGSSEKVYKCSIDPETGVRTGQCEPTTEGKVQGTFVCTDDNGDCSSCENNICSLPQYWKCDENSGNMREVSVANDYDLQTIPGDVASVSLLQKHAKACKKTKIVCNSELGVCEYKKVNPDDNVDNDTSVVSRNDAFQWCKDKCPKIGKGGFVWDSEKKKCEYVATNGKYATQDECLKSECSKNNLAYCEGADRCCNQANCEFCHNQKCISKCQYDYDATTKTVKEKDRPCTGCNGAGSCTQSICDPLQHRECVKDKCEIMPVPIGTFWNQGLEPKWVCKSGEYCMNSTKTSTYTHVDDAHKDKTSCSDVGCICPDNTACIKAQGMQTPPGGSQWYFPTSEFDCTSVVVNGKTMYNCSPPSYPSYFKDLFVMTPCPQQMSNQQEGQVCALNKMKNGQKVISSKSDTDVIGFASAFYNTSNGGVAPGGSATRWTSGYVGGNGGGPVVGMCDTGKYVTNISQSETDDGQYVSGVQMVCNDEKQLPRIGASYKKNSSIVSPTGFTKAKVKQSGDYVSKIEFFNAENGKNVVSDVNGRVLECPPGLRIIGYDANHGSWIDRAAIVCDK